MKQIAAIATITFHELIREKILWSAVVFAILCVGLAYAVSALSFTENARIALDFGLTSVSLVGGVISSVMGASLIAREVQNRTLYLILTKAIWRWQFVIGRLLGLLLVLALNSILMISIALGIYLLSGGQLHESFFQSFLLQFFEFGILASVASIFSSFSTTTLAAICTLGVWIIGHAMSGFKVIAEKIADGVTHGLAQLLVYILPDLTKFDIKSQVSHDLPVTWLYTLVTCAYGTLYIAFALAAACIVFSRRDL